MEMCIPVLFEMRLQSMGSHPQVGVGLVHVLVLLTMEPPQGSSHSDH